MASTRADGQFALPAADVAGWTAIAGIAVDVADGRGGRRQFGDLLLSRLPVHQAARHLLPWPAAADHVGMPRISVEVVIEAPELGELRMTTAHMAYYGAAQRLAQFDAQRALHAQSAAYDRGGRPPRADEAGGPFHWRPAAGIVCGDFNCEPGSPGHACMLEPFGDGTPARVATRGRSPTRTHHTTRRWGCTTRCNGRAPSPATSCSCRGTWRHGSGP